MGGVRPLVVVEVDPAPDAGLALRSGFPGVEVDAFVFQGPPEALDEDIVQASAFAVHGDPGAAPFQAVGPGEAGELAALVGVHDLGRPEFVDRLSQRFDAELERSEIGLGDRFQRTTASSVFDNRHDSNFRVSQSMTATR